MNDRPNLAAALAAFQAEAPTVSKGKTAKVPTKAGGSYSYTYANLADVVEAADRGRARRGVGGLVAAARCADMAAVGAAAARLTGGVCCRE